MKISFLILALTSTVFCIRPATAWVFSDGFEDVFCDGSDLSLTIRCQENYTDYSCDGVMHCEAGGWGPCEMPEELCDYLDNDCNGVVDDPFIDTGAYEGLYLSDEHCGVCNNSCISQFSNAIGNCEVQDHAAQCGFTCNDGFVDLNLGADDGCECEITTEICDGLDNDCDGEIDEGCNDSPVANADGASVNEGESVNIDLAANDTDAEGALDLSSIYVSAPPKNGSIIVNGDGTVDYIHNGSETISDGFNYSISDDHGSESNTASVAITINPVND